jgi:transcriptional regulator with XRE-family HTH domain
MKFHIEKLNTILLKARISRGFSQSFMATKLGISQKAYSYLESGHCKLDIIKFLKIAHHTEIHPMIIIEKITDGSPSWRSIDNGEKDLKNEVEKLEAQIAYLKSHNNFLKDTVVKLLDKSRDEK